MSRASIFVTGGTGYIGRRLIPRLVTRGFDVRALVRPGSERKAPQGCSVIRGNALDRWTFAAAVPRGSVVVHLVGTPHPSPAKAAEFESVDFVSAQECIAAAKAAGARHFVYVSVAQPAPVMRAYVNVRARVEALLRESGIPSTILRPWYVLGPGHRWAYALLPLYWMASAIPTKRQAARRLGLVTLDEMLETLTWAIATADRNSRLLEVPEIRSHGRPEKQTA
jgi:uncharacterized protein YbjT (DUF2867 family)